MTNTNQPKSEPKPRKKRKYITKEERRRSWGQGMPIIRSSKSDEKREESKKP